MLLLRKGAHGASRRSARGERTRLRRCRWPTCGSWCAHTRPASRTPSTTRSISGSLPRPQRASCCAAACSPSPPLALQRPPSLAPSSRAPPTRGTPPDSMPVWPAPSRSPTPTPRSPPSSSFSKLQRPYQPSATSPLCLKARARSNELASWESIGVRQSRSKSGHSSITS